MAYLIPLAYAAVIYMLVWVTGLGSFYDKAFVGRFTQHFGLGALPAWVAIPFYFFFVATTGMLNSCYTALGEEIGWRGFLVPELAKRNSFTATALFSGCVWSLWHYPILLFADYNAGTPALYGLSCFTVMIISMSFVLAWLRLKSGSLWTGVLLHASHNIFIQDFFTPITANTGRTKYIIDEFGVGLALVVILFGVLFWKRRAEVDRGVIIAM